MARKQPPSVRGEIMAMSKSNRTFDVAIGFIDVIPEVGFNNQKRYMEHAYGNEWLHKLLQDLRLPYIKGRWYRISYHASIGKIILKLEVKQIATCVSADVSEKTVGENQRILDRINEINWAEFDAWCRCFTAREVFLELPPHRFQHIQYDGHANRVKILNSFIHPDFEIVRSRHGFFTYDVLLNGERTCLNICFIRGSIEVYIGITSIKNRVRHRAVSIRGIIATMGRIYYHEMRPLLNDGSYSLLEEAAPIIRPFAQISLMKGTKNHVLIGFKWTIPNRNLQSFMRDPREYIDIAEDMSEAAKTLIIDRMFEFEKYV